MTENLENKTEEIKLGIGERIMLGVESALCLASSPFVGKMDYEMFQKISDFFQEGDYKRVLLGSILAATTTCATLIFAYGSYYFGKKALNIQKKSNV